MQAPLPHLQLQQLPAPLCPARLTAGLLRSRRLCRQPVSLAVLLPLRLRRLLLAGALQPVASESLMLARVHLCCHRLLLCPAAWQQPSLVQPMRRELAHSPPRQPLQHHRPLVQAPVAYRKCKARCCRHRASRRITLQPLLRLPLQR